MPKDEEARDRRQGCLIGLALLPFYFWLTSLGCKGMATAAVGAAAALLCALVTFWKLRWTHWFWPVFIAIAFVHTAAILLIRWPDYYIPGPVLRPFLMADGMAVIIVIASIDWLVRRWKKRERE